jgi:hypothetical protein
MPEAGSPRLGSLLHSDFSPAESGRKVFSHTWAPAGVVGNLRCPEEAFKSARRRQSKAEHAVDIADT